MATVARGKSTPAKRDASTKAVDKPAAETAAVAPVSRREFLYYIWSASIVLLLGQTTAAIIWFALPRFGEGTFGGIFTFGNDIVPPQGDAPVNEPAGRFWMANSEEGLTALYNVCTHLGCLPRWVPTNDRFECPCHGSKFELNGIYIEGPATRSLDQFVMRVIFADGTVLETPSDGGAVNLQGRAIREIQRIEVDTGNRLRGPGI